MGSSRSGQLCLFHRQRRCGELNLDAPGRAGQARSFDQVATLDMYFRYIGLRCIGVKDDGRSGWRVESR